MASARRAGPPVTGPTATEYIDGMPDVTQILSAIEQGDPSAAEQLLPLVYDELSRLASLQMAHDRPGETLNPTVLVHEAYLRLVGEGNRPATITVVTSSRRPPPPCATSA